MIAKRLYIPGCASQREAKSLCPWARHFIRVSGGYVCIGIVALGGRLTTGVALHG